MLHDSHLLNVEYINSLKEAVDFSKDFPEYVFKDKQYQFLFFEREFILFHDLMKDLIDINNSIFENKAIVSFGNPNLEGFSYYSFDGVIDEDLEQLRVIFERKFLENNTYPIVFTNERFDWIYFESLHEEFGVLAVRKEHLDKEVVVDFLNDNFLSLTNIEVLYQSGLGKLADMIKKSYTTK